ncbi:MAG: sn-glycerol-3-phosphate ABC transporter ATP-binding protein UgpC [Firmicutes bacterium]|nr:sn-glycerol-3-phosphate ABC transporter ATP-binding protein UgpC [Bacillota bacterium]
MATVKLENITKEYEDGYRAVSNLNLDIKDKEFIVLVGPSGCGKSTTLRMIAGLENITGGSMYIGESVVNDIDPKDRDIAMVFQSYALYPHMTIRDNMGFALKMRKTPQRNIDKKVDEIAEILQLNTLLDRKPGELSGGQRQRVALGRAMVRNPKVFLFDEPLSNLDAKLRVQMRSEIVKLHKELDTTFIYVTHDQTEAMTMGDRIAVLNAGVLEQFDTPLNLYNRPRNKFIAQFIGSPQMNVLPSEVSKIDGKYFVRFITEWIKIPYHMTKSLDGISRKNVYLGIRCEDFLLDEAGIPIEFSNVEYMGSDLYCYTSYNNEDIVMRFKPEDGIYENRPYKILPNMDRIYIFDYETEETIVYPAEV